MRYSIVSATYPADLELRVNKHLEEGWELVGGLAIRTVGGEAFYFQAMVLK